MIVIKPSRAPALAACFLFARLLLTVINYYQNELKRIMNGKGETADFTAVSSFTTHTAPFQYRRETSEASSGRSEPSMGVIGRLDDQVNEIIIKPVGARRKPESEATKAAPEEPSPQTGAEESMARDEENQEARPQPELPVWLL
jgi:hypothetical protein